MTTEGRALITRLALAGVSASVALGLVAALAAMAGNPNDPRLGPPTPATGQPTTTVARLSVISTRPS